MDLLDLRWSERLHEARLRTWAEVLGVAIVEGER
jgi:hypothetical protein